MTLTLTGEREQKAISNAIGILYKLKYEVDYDSLGFRILARAEGHLEIRLYELESGDPRYWDR